MDDSIIWSCCIEELSTVCTSTSSRPPLTQHIPIITAPAPVHVTRNKRDVGRGHNLEQKPESGVSSKVALIQTPRTSMSVLENKSSRGTMNSSPYSIYHQELKDKFGSRGHRCAALQPGKVMGPLPLPHTTSHLSSTEIIPSRPRHRQTHLAPFYLFWLLWPW